MSHFSAVSPVTCKCSVYDVGRNVLNENCKNTIEGEFQFNYEFWDTPGICDNSENRISACQEPGSAFRDNIVFFQYYRKCPGNAKSKNVGKLLNTSHSSAVKIIAVICQPGLRYPSAYADFVDS